MRRYELDTSYQGNMPNEVEFTLDNRYVVKIGDERFYNLMGETMLSAFNGLCIRMMSWVLSSLLIQICL